MHLVIFAVDNCSLLETHPRDDADAQKLGHAVTSHKLEDAVGCHQRGSTFPAYDDTQSSLVFE